MMVAVVVTKVKDILNKKGLIVHANPDDFVYATNRKCWRKSIACSGIINKTTWKKKDHLYFKTLKNGANGCCMKSTLLQQSVIDIL
jgi:hypothetical protein